MPSTISVVTRIGAFLPGISGGRDDDVAAGDDFQHHLALAPVERLVLRLRVAALVFGVGGLERQSRRTARRALCTCSFTAGPHVVGLDLRAEPPRRRDRLQPRDAGADDEDARGGDRAGRRHQHREHARQVVGRQQHALVAGDRRHRRERVHALRARDARHQLHRERRDARACASARIASGDPSGSAKPIDRLSAATARRLGRSRSHLQQDVGRREHVARAARPSRRPSRTQPRGIPLPRRRPARRRRRVPFFTQRGGRRRDQCDPAFAGPRLARDADLHARKSNLIRGLCPRTPTRSLARRFAGALPPTLKLRRTRQRLRREGGPVRVAHSAVARSQPQSFLIHAAIVSATFGLTEPDPAGVSARVASGRWTISDGGAFLRARRELCRGGPPPTAPPSDRDPDAGSGSAA